MQFSPLPFARRRSPWLLRGSPAFTDQPPLSPNLQPRSSCFQVQVLNYYTRSNCRTPIPCAISHRQQTRDVAPHFYEKAVPVKGDGFANDAATLLFVLEAQKVDALPPPLHLQFVLEGRSAATSWRKFPFTSPQKFARRNKLHESREPRPLPTTFELTPCALRADAFSRPAADTNSARTASSGTP